MNNLHQNPQSSAFVPFLDASTVPLVILMVTSEDCVVVDWPLAPVVDDDDEDLLEAVVDSVIFAFGSAFGFGSGLGSGVGSAFGSEVGSDFGSIDDEVWVDSVLDAGIDGVERADASAAIMEVILFYFCI